METFKAKNHATGRKVNLPEYIVYGIGYPYVCESLEDALEFARKESAISYNDDIFFYVCSLNQFHLIATYLRGKSVECERFAIHQPLIEARASK